MVRVVVLFVDGVQSVPERSIVVCRFAPFARANRLTFPGVGHKAPRNNRNVQSMMSGPDMQDFDCVCFSSFRFDVCAWIGRFLVSWSLNLTSFLACSPMCEHGIICV